VSSARQVQGARLAGEHGQALELALAVWREGRAPVVADAIALLDAEAASLFSGHRGHVRVHFQRAWLALAAARPGTLQVGWLARTLSYCLPPDEVTRYRYVRLETQAFLERLSALGELGPDPRMAEALGRFLVERPLYARTQAAVEGMYGGALRLLVQMEDVRQLAVCDALLEEDGGFGDEPSRYLRARLPEARARLAAVPQIEPPDAELWAAMCPQDVLPDDGSQGEELLAAVYADPEDDGARMVYADWLQERGDVRGEFITLQMRADDELARKRAVHLLRLHKYDWLGPDLSEVLCNVEFERGFPREGTLEQNARANRENWANAVQDARLGTIHTLWKGRGNATHYMDFLSSPFSLGLRRIELSAAQCVREALELPLAEQRRFHRLELTFVTRRPLLEQIGSSPSFRELSCLSYRMSPAHVASLLYELEDYELPGRIDTLALRAHRGEPNLGVCWARLRGTIRTLLVEYEGCSLRLWREGKGTVLGCPARARYGQLWQHVLSVLWGLREGLGREEEITVRGLNAGEIEHILEHEIGRNLAVTWDRST
jgi:uncharacterized protein (TIGR02996 family)